MTLNGPARLLVLLAGSLVIMLAAASLICGLDAWVIPHLPDLS